ncbi:hypothetical protein ElyMa_000961500 [Elysia marginata]|uniref:Uncharacterized protein n=1 Tax=Elysia marginata TaxID=1093978 RepID=A0AAV4HEB9_9GAST|nr:hypothetical protein ElyMa_000961500 [Elysia marginata]
MIQLKIQEMLRNEINLKTRPNLFVVRGNRYPGTMLEFNLIQLKQQAAGKRQASARPGRQAGDTNADKNSHRRTIFSDRMTIKTDGPIIRLIATRTVAKEEERFAV